MTIQPNYFDAKSILASGGKARDLVAHAVDDLPIVTRAVMVSLDGTIITGYLVNDPDTEHSTFGLLAGLMHSMAFKRITAITGGTVKGYQ